MERLSTWTVLPTGIFYSRAAARSDYDTASRINASSSTAPPNRGGRRSAVHRHHPDAGDRCRAKGAVRACRRADGLGAGRLYAVAGIPALRPGRSAVGQPRPLRAVGRPRLDAALCADPSAGVQAASMAAASPTRPAISLDDIKNFRQIDSVTPGPSGIRPHHRRRDHDRSARPRLRQQRRHGDRVALARRPLQSEEFHDLRLRRLHRLQRRRSHGRRGQRGGLARRPSAARKSVLDLRQQYGDHRRPHRSRFQRGRRDPL